MRLCDLKDLLENAHTIDDLNIYDSSYLSWVADVLTNIVTKIDELQSRRNREK